MKKIALLLIAGLLLSNSVFADKHGRDHTVKESVYDAADIWTVMRPTDDGAEADIYLSQNIVREKILPALDKLIENNAAHPGHFNILNRKRVTISLDVSKMGDLPDPLKFVLNRMIEEKKTVASCFFGCNLKIEATMVPEVKSLFNDFISMTNSLGFRARVARGASYLRHNGRTEARVREVLPDAATLNPVPLPQAEKPKVICSIQCGIIAESSNYGCRKNLFSSQPTFGANDLVSAYNGLYNACLNEEDRVGPTLVGTVGGDASDCPSGGGVWRVAHLRTFPGKISCR